MYTEQRLPIFKKERVVLNQTAQAGVTHESELGRESGSNSQPTSVFFPLAKKENFANFFFFFFLLEAKASTAQKIPVVINQK